VDVVGSFEGRVALITGAARGQGRAHALALARAGADIVATDRCADLPAVSYPLATDADLAETVRLVEGTGHRCLSVVADVADRTAMDDVVRQSQAHFGRIDIAIANAGVSVHGSVQDLSPRAWSDCIGTNLTGAFNTIAAVAPVMIRQEYGRIITISSMLGRLPRANQTAYGASKWGVIGMSKSAAQDLAPHGITVNVIAPGNVDTPMIHNESTYGIVRPDLTSPSRSDVAGALASLHLIREPWLSPDEISRAVLFLASEASAYLTGIVLPVDAGAAARLPT
jgi:SDR family mycofactocin-dependent oxidoreductase